MCIPSCRITDAAGRSTGLFDYIPLPFHPLRNFAVNDVKRTESMSLVIPRGPSATFRTPPYHFGTSFRMTACLRVYGAKRVIPAPKITPAC